MLKTKYQSLYLPVSEEKNFEDGILCSYVLTCDPRVGANVDPNMNKLGKGPPEDATYQISKL